MRACWNQKNNILIYIIKKERISVDALFDASRKGKYYYNNGFNQKGMLAWIIASYIAIGTVWPNIFIFDGLINFFGNLNDGYAWMIGAALGAVIHLGISNK